MSADAPKLTALEDRLATLEAEAKMQLRVARAVLKQKLGMCGNVLLVAWALATAMLLIWLAFVVLVPDWQLTWSYFIPLLRVEPDFIARINVLALAIWKTAAYLLFLFPGLALKICASAMGQS